MSAPGTRKSDNARQTAIFLLAGLVVTLTAASFFKFDNALCAQMFVIYVGGLVGKDTAFVWGNRGEHSAKAKATPPISPTS